MKNKLSVLLPLCLLSLGATNCTTPFKFDDQISSIDAVAATMVFNGCGKTSDKYLFCHKEDGSNASETFYIIFPKLNCDLPSCVDVEFFRAGNSVLKKSLDKTKTKLPITFTELLNKEEIEFNDSDEFQIIATIYYKVDDILYTSFQTGPVRLWVTKKGFKDLSCNDPNVVFKAKISKTCEAHYSSSFRSSICGDCK